MGFLEFHSERIKITRRQIKVVFPIRSVLAVISVIIVTVVFVFPWDQDCSGDAACISGKVTEVTDGDTITVNDKPIRFALASAPELDQFGGIESREFIEKLCPVGSPALVDEDDGQIKGIYDRMIGLIRCNGKILNEELVTSGNGEIAVQFCSISEFSDMDWASNNGC